MIDQKLRNEQYQNPAIDLAKAEETLNTTAEHTPQVKSTTTHLMNSSNPKRTEIQRALDLGAQTLSGQDVANLMDHAFKVLEVD